MDKIKLGDVVRDSISGMEGVVIADTMWLNGCRRLQVQPRELKDGKPVEGQSFDEEQLELVTGSVLASKGRERQAQPARAYTGGPGAEPTRQSTPPRI